MTRQATETIRVTPETWKRLNQRKQPGDTFNDVITRLLEEGDTGNLTPPTQTAD